MKNKILTLILVLFASAANAQNDSTGIFPLVNGVIKITKVQIVPNQTKTEIYGKVRAFIGKNFISSKAVTDVDDPASGTYVGKGIIDVPGIPNNLKTTMSISVKNNKYRIEFENLLIGYDLRAVIGSSGFMPFDKTYQKYLDKKRNGKKVDDYEKFYGSIRRAIDNLTNNLQDYIVKDDF